MPEFEVGGGGAGPGIITVSVANVLTGHIVSLGAMTLTYIKAYRIANKLFGTAEIRIKGAIYKEVGAEYQKVAETEEDVKTDDFEGWVTMNFPSPVNISGGVYFIGIGGNSLYNAQNFIGCSMEGCVRKRKEISYPTFPDPITSWTTPDGDECMNIFVGYEEVAVVKRIMGDGLVWVMA